MEGSAKSEGEAARAAAIVEDVARMLVETADPVWGGWGERQKFPHPDALHFLLVRGAETRDDALLDVAKRTLETSQAAEIHDAVEGGFYRFATQPDWSVPDYEKPLLANAKRLLAAAEAYQVFGTESLRDTARKAASWMRATLLDPTTGAFGATQDADPVYARLGSMDERRAHGAPEVDPTVHADRNAWAAVAFLKAGFVLGEGSLTETGLGALDFVLTRLFDRKRGVHHYWNGSPNRPGELRDQAAVLRAIVEAAHSGSTNRFLETGLTVAAWCEAELSLPDGSFRGDVHQDAAHASARSAEDLRAHGLLGEALLRLSVLTGRPELADRARAALLAFEDAWRPHGFAAAGFGRALHLVAREPAHVVVVGRRGDARTSALAEAGRRTYVASRVAQLVDPADEAALLEALGLEPREAPYASLRAPGVELTTTDPAELASGVEALRGERGPGA